MSSANSKRNERRLFVELCEERRMLAAFEVTSLLDEIVTAPDDTFSGSLRQMIVNANLSQGPDTITFDPTVFDPTDGVMDTIVLTEGQLTITDALTINGPGWDELTIDASGSDANTGLDLVTGLPSKGDGTRVFNITTDFAGDYAIRDLAITGGGARRMGARTHHRSRLRGLSFFCRKDIWLAL